MSNPIKRDIHFWMTVAIVGIFIVWATACTTATVVTADGTSIKYRDFHPTGNVMEVDAVWEGIGSLTTSRSTDGAEAFVEAVGDAVDPL